MDQKKTLISFDFDGVIVNQMNSWGLIRDRKGMPDGRIDDYATGKINGKEFRDSEHVIFKKFNLRYEDFIEAGKKEKLHSNVLETIMELYNRGYILLVNSAGPRPTILTVLRRFQPQPFKYVFSMVPLFNVNNVFYDTYLPFEDSNQDVDKVRVLVEVAKRENVPVKSIIHVGDGVTDIACFKICIGVSFNSHNRKVIENAKYNLEEFKDLIDLI
ncbi:MAG: haloacid dehalogenase-like hydrolase [Candidatus Helarchaeota archaeon]|nr:haloacid dehalogenase-like hydrolase [Candidatus Helarchaeota archaeon]